MRHHFESRETFGRVNNNGEGQKGHEKVEKDILALPLPYSSCKLKVTVLSRRIFFRVLAFFFFFCFPQRYIPLSHSLSKKNQLRGEKNISMSK